MEKNLWLRYNQEELNKVFEFAESYKEFLSASKTEREFVQNAVLTAKEKGFVDLEQKIKTNTPLKPGDRLYCINKEKNLALFVIGKKSLEEGMNILGAHLDSPRLDVKPNPLYQRRDFGYLDTHYYGGIKKYQWVTLPLALHGVVIKKDGTKIMLNIGESESDPVVGISDLLIHLAAEQMKKPANNVIEGEDLDVMIGSIPLQNSHEKEAVKANLLKLLKEKYDMDEEDFYSAEIEVVPAGKARDYGLDRSMVLGYGQDDKVCAYTSLQAILDTEVCDLTSVCLLVDKEEIGSYGATGMQSLFFENIVAEMCSLNGLDRDLALRRALSASSMLSSDVNAGYDPLYSSVMEEKNSCYLGHGLVFNKYTGARGKSGSSDASPEFIAKLRNILDESNIGYQFAELGKVDAGGGGTIAYILANYNMEVIDAGVAVLSMHAPFEITSKADIYEAYKGYQVFLKNA